MNYPECYGEAEHIRALDRLLADIQTLDNTEKPTLRLHHVDDDHGSDQDESPDHQTHDSEASDDAFKQSDEDFIDRFDDTTMFVFEFSRHMNRSAVCQPA